MSQWGSVTSMRVLKPFMSWKVHRRLFSTTSSLSRSSNADFVYHNRVEIANPGLQPRIAGRKFTPMSTNPGNEFPEYLACPRDNRPALYQAVGSTASIKTWAEKTRSILDEKLHIHGAILFRGMPLTTTDEFSRFFKALGYNNASHVGGNSSRHEVSDMVYTGNDNDPNSYTLDPHNEMSYTHFPPRKVLIFCVQPTAPGCGGESAVVDVRDLLPNLDKDVVDKFDRLGVRYYNYVGCKYNTDGSHRTWQESFRNEDKSEVMKIMDERGIEYEWGKDNWLSYWYNLPAFRIHPTTDERIWFNMAMLNHASYFFGHPRFENKDIPYVRYPYHTTYGDGSEIEMDVILHIRNVTWQVAGGFPLKKSDVLVYDNMYSQHARIGYTGERKVYLSFTDN